ncbi:MAG: hypothetical protein U9N51_06300 [Bacteroidota bacterium]|nr:hypothetical protein [Bacteroidota bacterium]
MKRNIVKLFLGFILIFIFTHCDKINEKGKVVFYGYPDITNCIAPYIIITVNNDCVGILIDHSDSITIEKPMGRYNYRAEFACKQDHKIGYWENSFEIKKDNCTQIYLHFFDTTQPFYAY